MRDADQCEVWIGAQEAFLLNEDLGVRIKSTAHLYYVIFTMYVCISQTNLDSVEALIRKHGDFEKSLDAQEEKINALDETATKLVLADHYDVQKITKRRGSVVER